MLRSLLPAAAPRASRLHFGDLCLRLADLELCAGNAVAALEILEDVRGCIAPYTYSSASRYLLTARARFARNDVAAAREAECLRSLDVHRAARSA
jgi:hypothetical protein